MAAPSFATLSRRYRISNGRKFRLKGQGLEKGGRKGDQVVAVAVRIPEKLTEEQAAAFKEWSAGLGK